MILFDTYLIHKSLLILQDEFEVDARSLKIGDVLSGIPVCLLEDDLFVLFSIFDIGFEELLIGRRVDIDFLVNEIRNASDDIPHGGFGFPVLSFEQGHADVASCIDVDMQELFFELNSRRFHWILLRKCYCYRIDTFLPNSMLFPRNPKNPHIISRKSFVNTRADFYQRQIL